MRVAKKMCEFALMKPRFTIVGITFLFGDLVVNKRGANHKNLIKHLEC
ncbi:hypothetical protein PEC301296_07640 [Pectobacterium carotovorum subsp. carotovorum]|nr:hypothetical protein PEC301296_07640 [Pectobacterium carotovorum subsp. carotovorum]